ncbi:MAG TPA: murein biosynthesis integral membrane protein MurJ [Chloroflexota bacterium]|nr:murein biosynthesis integral membrane protein MurJ [Chloroflexota bacterium]
MQRLMGAAVIVMSGFVASKLLGLVRNIVISHQYGASRDYEMFLAAISVPDTVFQVLAGGAVSAAFIPVFATYLSQSDRERAWRLASALVNVALITLGCVSALLALAAPAIMGILVAGWPPENQARAATLTRIMLVTPAVFAASALLTSALNAVHRFALAAAAPLAYNLSLICSALLFRSLGAEALALGAVVGAFLHLGVQVPGALRVGMRYSLTLGLDLQGTRDVIRLMLPRVIGLGVSQVNQLINVALASFLVVGSIAYLNYAWLILMVPLGIFAMGLSTALFPTLARQSAEARADEERATFLFGLRLILYTTIPAAIGLIVLGRPIVSLLLQRGAFTGADAAATAMALGWYAIGLPGHSMIEIVDRVFYAERNTATPVRVAAGAVLLNVALSLVLMRTGLSFGGLALANSIAALAEATTLTLLLQRTLGWVYPVELLDFGWRIGLSAIAMGVTAMLLQGIAGQAGGAYQWIGQLALVVGVTGASGVTYVAVAHLLGVRDARMVARLLRGR